MWIFILIYAISLSQTVALSCKPRSGGTPVPIGVFTTSVLPYSLDMKPFDVIPSIKLALNYIQNHSCILNGYKLELIYKDTKSSDKKMSKKFFIATDSIHMYLQPHVHFVDELRVSTKLK
ncbi:hypothetical protein DICVIV_09204 [Dictyocaulus viviparus]|uniref:Receptor ligand binding region domain-containing protein n=1 Tax=Dictyocaulus viviparus TaxID=29172 RepID=A0A0D8XR14_DICVI|nr:hypothetical protein DICVIV_09204 [Dictyocaulus viviparus]